MKQCCTHVNDVVSSNVWRLHSMMFPPSGIRPKIEQTDINNIVQRCYRSNTAVINEGGMLFSYL